MPKVVKDSSYAIGHAYAILTENSMSDEWFNGHVYGFTGTARVTGWAVENKLLRQRDRAKAVEFLVSGGSPPKLWLVAAKFCLDGRTYHRGWNYGVRKPTSRGLAVLVHRWMKSLTVDVEKQRRKAA